MRVQPGYKTDPESIMT